MKFGLYVPNYGKEMSAAALADLAAEAEEAGWDGFYLWDHMNVGVSQKTQIVDPWVSLAAMAMKTEKLRLGTTVTPVPRRRPWKLARETATLDHLSKGRVTLGVGLGHPPENEFENFGEDGDAKVRALRLDEGLDIIAGLWKGKPFSYEGQVYHMGRTQFLPGSYQQPRIPVWVGGFLPNPGPIRRAARWDGMFPLAPGEFNPAVLRELAQQICELRGNLDNFDFIVLSNLTGPVSAADYAKKIAAFEKAGATWSLQMLFREKNSVEAMRERIRQGPPRVG